ncbi:MAG TPA: prolyl oligopeptidase family serine peptidase [Chitinophagaceae bacterium]|nr:prolyl oligopeptidase family serine peptidase [Chitinophagaceae bacterium]
MRQVCLFALLLLALTSRAQDDAGYITPPKDIQDMLLAKPTPGISISDNGQWILFSEQNSYSSVEELARPELRIAGLRIDPANYTRSRQRYINNIYLKKTGEPKEYKIAGLPADLAASSISWSPDDKKIAFIHTTATKADLYVVDIAALKATKVNKQPLNLVMNDYDWLDNNTLLYHVAVKPASAAPAKSLMPKGPAVQENYGKASPRPTYQDMIKSPYDEDLFAFYATSQLVKNVNGNESKIGAPAIYASVNPSPDKKYLLVRTIQKPFSYLVPASGFAASLDIADATTGKIVKHIMNVPSTETAPSGYDNVQNQPRSHTWRGDMPSTLVWCEPLDSGMIKKEVPYHDAVYQLAAPFTSSKEELFKTKMRYMGTTWGDGSTALVTEGLRSKQLTQINRFFAVTGDLEKIFSRNTTDAYSNPGFPVTAPNKYGRNVLVLTDNGNKVLFNNTTGSSPKGDLPFLLSFDLHTKKADTLWRCQEGYFESVARVLDPNKLTIVTRRESEKEVPNYWLKNLKLRIADQQLTAFTNPYPQLEGVSKEKITYKREDGITLTGDLYLPKGYDAKRDGPLPVFIWAYPAEYNSADDAAQIRGSRHRFTTLSWGSAIPYVTQGYAVLNNAEMPIVATDKEKKPNDNFVDQLRMNAEAAINKLAEMGVGDRNRMAVGGHSYGAFMTANLLAHTSLFKAGIARSGAYNRSLTPFGFQNEDRTYWQDPKLYNDMSPFSHADKIKTPILLIHGDMDNNTGTYPIQSERMFNAIKGHGGTAKYISLPYESHGYAGRENILHTLAEQFNWLEKYVKNAQKDNKQPDKIKAF